MPDFDLAVFIAKFPWMSFASSMLLSMFFFLALKPLARRTGWVDKPSNRKAHVGEIPLIGGWGVLLVAIIMQLLGPASQRAPYGFWIGGLLLFVVALADDRSPIRARYRALVQFGAAVAGVMLGGQMLPSLGNLLGFGTVSAWWIMLPVSIVGTVAVINAVNFTDGADGLCGGLSFISLFWFLISLMIAAPVAAAIGEPSAPYAASMVPLAAALCGGLAGFLWFNLRSPFRRKAAIFLGDSGSMLLGFTLAWFSVHVTSAYGAASPKPVVCLWVLAVPLADSASCIVRRIREGVTPMTPDLKHLHHLLMRFGMSPARAVFVIHIASFLCGMVGVVGWAMNVPEPVLFGGFVLSLLAFTAWTNLMWYRIDQLDRQAGKPLGAGGARS
ncbi:MAG: MraY family glycosyltransferase [Lautropia sp.]|nr:MraY family glycosyltransferase [Lautropia sp.]